MAKKKNFDTVMPLHLISKTEKLYPRIWGKIEELRTSAILKKYSWPKKYYISIDVSEMALQNMIDSRPLPTHQKLLLFYTSAGLVDTLAIWRLSKQIYKIDKDLEDLLLSQKGFDELPTAILKEMPFSSAYIKTNNLAWNDTSLDGFFVTTTYDGINQEEILLFTFIGTEGETFNANVYLNETTLDRSLTRSLDKNKEVVKQVYDAFGSENEFIKEYPAEDEFKTSRVTRRVMVNKALQILLYILAANADTRNIKKGAKPLNFTEPIEKQLSQIKDKYREVTEWDVGVRIGSVIRRQNRESEAQNEATEVNVRGNSESLKGHSKRPHMRRGHYHAYWTGKRSDKENRKMIHKWIAPQFINAALGDEMPAVIHPVK